jgi:hypothetical protein
MKQITTTGHHLLPERVDGALACDCGWGANPNDPESMQLREALIHHQQVCAKIVADSVWWRRAWKWVRS